MKTIDEAANILGKPEGANSYKGFVETVLNCPLVMLLLIEIASAPIPQSQRLLQAVSAGICIGIEMEKP